MERYTAEPKALTQTEVWPVVSQLADDGSLCLDFGKAAFGTLLISMPENCRIHTIIVHLGEKLGKNGRIERQPQGAIRTCQIEQQIDSRQPLCRLIIPPDKRNTGPAAIKMPSHIGEVVPFRYVEIEDAADIDPATVRQLAVHYPFDETASSFHSSDSVLNAVWELCKYTIKATTFCGVYVDGDRERIPYEGDAYVNQLSHYSVDREYALARFTHEYLLHYPTWPTEWQIYSVMMAWADYLYTGEMQSLTMFYDDLCVKTLIDLARHDGLISTESALCTEAFERRLNLYHPRYVFKHGLQDLVDWPPGSFTEGGQGERDGHEMRPVNTVVNAFHYHALILMAQIALLLGKTADQQRFVQRAAQVKATINRLLFDSERGMYVDGEGATHASLHSNMFALAFGLVPEARRPQVVAFVKSRGMACSVFSAQFLLEALYLNDEEQYALGLMTAQHDRSWWHMMQVGSTMTLEAWDWKYKNNLDWNHAWGTAPANIIPRFLMGVRPLAPGFSKILIQPRPGSLESAKMVFPTRNGSVVVQFENQPKQSFILKVEIPDNTVARIDLPRLDQVHTTVIVNSNAVNGVVSGRFVTIDGLGVGHHILERKQN